jgi:surface polysaccharide O-acyltransferase-like enzyme
MSKEIWLCNIRIIAAYCVILTHVSTGKDDVSLFFSSVSKLFPIWILISGSFQLSQVSSNVREFYRRKIKKLALVLLVWGSIYILFAHIFYTRYNFRGVVGSFLFSITPGSFHLWFLYLLLELYLVTPLLWKIQKYLSSTDLFIVSFTLAALLLDFPCLKFMGFAKTSLIELDSYPTLLTLFIPYLPHYLVGKAIKDLNLSLSRFQLVLLISVIILLLGYPLFLLKTCDLSFNSYQSFDGFLLSSAIFLLFFQIKKPLFGSKLTMVLAIHSFGIYLIHNLVRNTLGLLSMRHENLINPIFLPLYALLIMLISERITSVLRKSRWVSLFV